jgi:hypothetical protein
MLRKDRFKYKVDTEVGHVWNATVGHVWLVLADDTRLEALAAPQAA